MTIQSWLLVALAGIDIAIITKFYFQLRVAPPYDKQMLSMSAGGLAGFVFHAFAFFEGMFLFLQLTSIACIFGLCYLNHKGVLAKVIH